MKTPRLLLLIFLMAPLMGIAADNFTDANTRPIGSANRAIFRSTEVGEIHTPHVTFAAASSISTGQATLSTSASEVSAVDPSRRSIVIDNHDAAISIYVGEAGVTTTTGKLVRAGQSITINSTASIYAVAASGTPVISYLTENE